MSDSIGSREVCRQLDIDKATLSRWVHSTPPRITPVLKLPGKNGAMLFNPDDVASLKAQLADAGAAA